MKIIVKNVNVFSALIGLGCSLFVIYMVIHEAVIVEFVYFCGLNSLDMTMKQKFVLEKKAFAVLMGLLAVLLFVPSCTTDDKVPDLSDEGTNDWIYKVMTNHYLWNEDVPDKGNLNFSQSPDKFFESLLSDQDGVKYEDRWLTFSRIEKKKEETKSVTAADSYGFEFVSYKDGSFYYAWVLYVLPGSPAAEAGLKRGDWIIAVGSETPNVTNTSAFYSGSETSFLLADAVRKGNEVTFYKRKTISIAASRAVEDTPFLKDSVYTINGKKIGYLVYNSFSSGPDDESTAYDDRMKQVFAGFKTENVSEFVLDLRYNQGGLVTCAQLMTSLLAPAKYLGKTFCFMEHNEKQSKSNETLLLKKNAELGNANLDLKRIYVLTGSVTASASEAVINCLIPYLTRSNITIIGEKTIGKRVGSNTFGTKEEYGWLLHPITLRIYNADHKADYANGFEPDVKIKELVVGNELLPFGDMNEMLLNEALSRITGLKSQPERAESEGRVLLAPSSFERRKIKGLIFESER